MIPAEHLGAKRPKILGFWVLLGAKRPEIFGVFGSLGREAPENVGIFDEVLKKNDPGRSKKIQEFARISKKMTPV